MKTGALVYDLVRDEMFASTKPLHPRFLAAVQRAFL